MKRNDKIAKILLTVLTFGFIIWFGGAILRTAIGYDLFYPDAKLMLKEQYDSVIRMYNVHLYTSLSLYTDIAFGGAFLAACGLLIALRKELKHSGWVFMSLMLFILAAPVQLYGIYCDIKLAQAVIYGNVKDFFSPEIQEYFFFRFKNIAFTTASSLAFLAYITAIVYLIWRPLDGKQSEV